MLVSMDFISGFSTSKEKGSVMVIIDRLTKYAIFVAVPKVCTADVAVELFFKFAVKKFGILEDIVSDQDPRFKGISEDLAIQNSGFATKVLHSLSSLDRWSD